MRLPVCPLGGPPGVRPLRFCNGSTDLRRPCSSLCTWLHHSWNLPQRIPFFGCWLVTVFAFILFHQSTLCQHVFYRLLERTVGIVLKINIFPFINLFMEISSLYFLILSALAIAFFTSSKVIFCKMFWKFFSCLYFFNVSKFL